MREDERESRGTRSTAGHRVAPLNAQRMAAVALGTRSAHGTLHSSREAFYCTSEGIDLFRLHCCKRIFFASKISLICFLVPAVALAGGQRSQETGGISIWSF